MFTTTTIVAHGTLAQCSPSLQLEKWSESEKAKEVSEKASRAFVIVATFAGTAFRESPRVLSVVWRAAVELNA